MAELIPAEAIGLTILTAFEVPNLYSGLLPSQFTIATFSGGDDGKRQHTTHWIRKSEIQATAMSLILGAGASVLAKSPYPFLATAMMCGYLLWQYETALRRGMESGPGMNMKDGAS